VLHLLYGDLHSGTEKKLCKNKWLRLTVIAFMRDDIIPAKITTKPRFENENLRFFHELIPKAVMAKRIPT